MVIALQCRSAYSITATEIQQLRGPSEDGSGIFAKYHKRSRRSMDEVGGAETVKEKVECYVVESTFLAIE